MTQEKILFLGPDDSPLIAWLRSQGEHVVPTSEPLSPTALAEGEFTFLISYGYRHILDQATLDLFPDRAINLHISYLPWNRGADPNFWSFVDATPKGVTIHHLDAGIDTGDIIVQQVVEFAPDGETLATTYAKLQAAIQALFQQHWPEIKAGRCPRHKQTGPGSSHRARDKDALAHLLTEGWQTPVAALLRS